MVLHLTGPFVSSAGRLVALGIGCGMGSLTALRSPSLDSGSGQVVEYMPAAPSTAQQQALKALEARNTRKTKEERGSL